MVTAPKNNRKNTISMLLKCARLTQPITVCLPERKRWLKCSVGLSLHKLM